MIITYMEKFFFMSLPSLLEFILAKAGQGINAGANLVFKLSATESPFARG
jgi:hypothetical protein